MNYIIIVLTIIGINLTCFAKNFDNEWKKFKLEHRKSFRNTKEETRRRLNWERNMKNIDKQNNLADNGLISYRLKMNEYGDLSDEEFNSGLLLSAEAPVTNTQIPRLRSFSTSSLPSLIDWRNLGAVTPIKNQGTCRACWAFSATAALEAQNFLKTGKLVSLSEQNLVDCSTRQGNQGCAGGWMGSAFQYVISNNGINTQQSYPYINKNGPCRFNNTSIGSTASSYVMLPSKNESALTQALANIGPISIGLDASLSSFRFYSSGVYMNRTCSQVNLNHAAALVGYGTDSVSGLDYYILKNSWGTLWGDKGYMLIARNQQNMCGIATSAVYPKL
jgi:cathepsin L